MQINPNMILFYYESDLFRPMNNLYEMQVKLNIWNKIFHIPR